MAILSGISSGKSVDRIVESLSPSVQKKAVQIREILDREISQSAAIRLQTCLNLIKHLDGGQTKGRKITCQILKFIR